MSGVLSATLRGLNSDSYCEISCYWDQHFMVSGGASQAQKGALCVLRNPFAESLPRTAVLWPLPVSAPKYPGMSRPRNGSLPRRGFAALRGVGLSLPRGPPFGARS